MDAKVRDVMTPGPIGVGYYQSIGETARTMGPTGASIFLREVQEIWPAVAPYVDAKVTSGANRVRLPGDRESLAGLLADSGQPARLAAALVRVSLSQRAASEVTASVRD